MKPLLKTLSHGAIYLNICSNTSNFGVGVNEIS